MRPWAQGKWDSPGLRDNGWSGGLRDSRVINLAGSFGPAMFRLSSNTGWSDVYDQGFACTVL